MLLSVLQYPNIKKPFCFTMVCELPMCLKTSLKLSCLISYAWVVGNEDIIHIEEDNNASLHEYTWIFWNDFKTQLCEYL